jgi:predicted GIY-YIG superfamily endonuclease
MKSTKAGCPWSLMGYLEFDIRSEAVQMERKIKARGIGRWVKDNMHLLVQHR